MNALTLTHLTIPLLLVQSAQAQKCYNSQGFRIKCPPNRTSAIVAGAIFGSIVLLFVLWYSYGRWRARNTRPVIRGSGVLAEDEVHLQPQQYAQWPSTDTVPIYSPPSDPPPNYPAPTNPGVPPTAYAAPNYPPPDSRPT